MVLRQLMSVRAGRDRGLGRFRGFADFHNLPQPSALQEEISVSREWLVMLIWIRLLFACYNRVTYLLQAARQALN